MTSKRDSSLIPTSLMISVSGVRGIIGEGLHPETISRFGSAFGTYIGKGPVVTRGPNINHKVYGKLMKTAATKKIPVQVEPASRATGTDANVIQLTRSGVAAGLISIPNRYMHTPVEMVDLRDIENAAKLLASYIETLKAGEDFSPF